MRKATRWSRRPAGTNPAVLTSPRAARPQDSSDLVRSSVRDARASGTDGGEDTPPRVHSRALQEAAGAVTGMHPQSAIPAVSDNVGLAATIEVPRADDGGEHVPSSTDEPRSQPSTRSVACIKVQQSTAGARDDVGLAIPVKSPG